MSKGIRGTAPGAFQVTAEGVTATVTPDANGDYDYAFPSSVASTLNPGDPISAEYDGTTLNAVLPDDPAAIAANAVSLAYATANGVMKIKVRTSDASPMQVKFGDDAPITLQSDVDYVASSVTGAGTAVVTPQTGATIERLENMDGGWSFDFSALSGLSDLNRLTSYSGVTMGGALSDLPDTLDRLICYSETPITGDTTDVPPVMEEMILGAGSRLAGDYADLPDTLTDLRVAGTGVLGGDIAGGPNALEFLELTGPTTISGDIASFPNSLKQLEVRGANTLSGSMVDKPTACTFFKLEGDNTVTEGSPTWPATMERVRVYGAAKSAAFVDEMLISLARDATTWTGDSRIDLANDSTNAARTAASDTAKTTLESRNVAVTVNEV